MLEYIHNRDAERDKSFGKGLDLRMTTVIRMFSKKMDFFKKSSFDKQFECGFYLRSYKTKQMRTKLFGSDS